MSELHESKTTSIVYISPRPSTFVLRDVQMLKAEFDVKLYCLDFASSLNGIIKLLKFHFQVLPAISKADFLIIRFLGYHSYIPLRFSNLLKKRNFVILGGVACHYFPEVSRGNKRKKLYGFFTRKSILHTQCFLPVHKTLMDYEYAYTEVEFKKQGLYNLYKEAENAKFQEIYNGFDDQLFVDREEIREKLSFLTVVSVIDEKTYLNKGIDLIEEIAKLHPEYKIYIVGKVALQRKFPSNMIFLGFKSQESLIELYNNKEFYLQLSISEGFPNALSEAMLCGCIPIVSDVFSMRDIVGDTGFILSKKSAENLSKGIAQLADSNLSELRVKARRRIQENFSLERRFKAMKSLLSA